MAEFRVNICQVCLRRDQVSYNRPKSQHKTKRLVRLNLQKWHKLVICNRCRRTLERQSPKTAIAVKS